MKVSRDIMKCTRERAEDDVEWSLRALHRTFVLRLFRSCVTFIIQIPVCTCLRVVSPSMTLEVPCTIHGIHWCRSELQLYFELQFQLAIPSKPVSLNPK